MAETFSKISAVNARLATQAEKLEAANKELESFAYSVSHDLRAPLRAMDGYARILLEDHESSFDPEARRLFDVIRAESKRMGTLIDDLLAFSRLSRREMVEARIDMKALASSVFKELMVAEDSHRVEFHIQELPYTTGDLPLIRQVWVNLLSNALKFTSKNERSVIEVGFLPEQQKQTYFVKDNGAGFDMNYVHKLFGVFQRLHSEQEFPGTGVGLAIVQRVILRHSGQVWAESTPQDGTTFYFTIPEKETPDE